MRNTSLTSALVGSVWLFAACGGDSGDDVSEKRVDSAITAYCENVIRCGIGVLKKVESCVDDRKQLYGAWYGNESSECRSAELADYECMASAACDKWSTGCPVTSEARDDACGK